MKAILFVLSVMILIDYCYSQSLDNESIRYWYYRDRLKYFVCPGAEEGNSIMMTSRNADREYGNETIFNSVEYGQTRKLNGYYIGMLATEYRLLKNNGQWDEAATTLFELKKENDALRKLIEAQ